MSPKPELLPVDDADVDAVTVLWNEPPARSRTRRRASVLLAHGSGSDLDYPLLEAVAAGLAERGLRVLRFRYAYMERAAREGRRRPPDRLPALEALHEQVLEHLRARSGGERILLAGRSLGGRVGSVLAAKGARCHGLVFLAYPLHPAKRPERERSEHFDAVVQPALFLQGTRDALCDLARLERALRRFGGSATVEVLEGADHGFHVRVRDGGRDLDVPAWLVERIDAWERAAFPG